MSGTGVVNPSVYRVKMFSERGYVRQKCKYCGEYFWSLRRRDDCGDAPCSDYTFFRLSKSLPSLTVQESRQRFLNFFNRKGHEIIDPYPVVARWRDDLYLTIASIIVFQPHVTSGMMPPPANPLVIAQPCIRLEDIDSVGYTFGRHLTSFIMGGHHAFNYPKKKVYFKDKTVELAMEFFTKEVGIPEDELVFKESWWEGGGNAGPSFEVTVGGLELATLVFMMYEVKDGKYIEMPIKIVDTGYGIERISWFSQGVPTAFHAIYGDLLKKYYDVLGLEEPPIDLLLDAVRHSGKLSPKNKRLYMKLKKVISEDTGYSFSEVGKYLDTAVMVYALLDHIKTAELMLADGIVPSNTGEGYLARLILRRIFRILSSLGSLSSISNLLELQAKYWVSLYPQLLRSLNYILDVTQHELSKFNDVLKRAPKIVSKYLKKGETGLTMDELIELYDSHGISPDMVKEISSGLGLKISVPEDFFSKVAARHSTAPIKKVKKLPLPDDVVKEASGFPPTELLFHKDPYLRKFRAKVISVIKSRYVVLDKTAFYPEGGGQAHDVGFIKVDGSGIELRVVDVQKVNDVVIHVLDGKADLIKGKEVVGEIDWFRRFPLMRHHTATHIVLGAARKVLGDHVWQAGAEKTPKRARLDITHYKPIDKDELKRIEDLANKVILEGREVRTYYLPKYEAEKKYGFRLYEGGVVLQPVLRVVEIEGFDAEACFGTHVTNTKDVGAIKITSVDRIADGVVRLEYVAGTEVAEYARDLEDKVSKASEILGGDLIARSKSVIQELSELKEKLRRYSGLYKESLINNLMANAKHINNHKLVVGEVSAEDSGLVKEILMEVSRRSPEVVAAILIRRRTGYQIELSLGDQAAKSYDASQLIKRILRSIGGSGGGQRTHASGFIKSLSSTIVSQVKDILMRFLKLSEDAKA